MNELEERQMSNSLPISSGESKADHPAVTAPPASDDGPQLTTTNLADETTTELTPSGTPKTTESSRYFARIKAEEERRINKDKKEATEYESRKNGLAEAVRGLLHFDRNEFLKLNGRHPADVDEYVAALAPRVVKYAQWIKSDCQDLWIQLERLDAATLPPAAEVVIEIMIRGAAGDEAGVVELLRQAGANSHRFSQVMEWLKYRLIETLRAIAKIDSDNVRREPPEQNIIHHSDDVRTEESEEGKCQKSGPRWKHWAIGVESGNKWHLFRQVAKGEWWHQGLVQISKGRRANLMKAFAEGGGLLSKVVALKLERTTYSASEVPKLMARITPELSKLRQVIRTATKVQDTKADPLPFIRGGWRAEIEIGYAIMDDSNEKRLQFKTRSQM